MFKKFFGNQKTPTRTLTSPAQLDVGDLITLKPRSTLPECLQGQTLEVIKVCAYEYPGGYEPEFTLKSPTGQVVYLSVNDDDGNVELTFSIEIPRDTVFALFGEQAFAELWGEDFAELVTRADHDVPGLEGWWAPVYRQEEKMAEAYFYNRDMRQQGRRRYADDDAEELRYHACTGGEAEEFQLTAEIWESGKTDVYLGKTFAATVIEEMWPNAKQG
jgi:hypothetical protein